MKRYYLKFQVIISALLMLVTAQSCRKETSHKQHCGHLIPIETDAKTGNQYLLICFLGHDAANCSGCLMINGKLVHVDCQGEGHACNKSSNVALSYDLNNNLYATTLDTFGFTSLDIFNMPSRSFALETDPGVYSYLNIPAQLIYRDSTTLQFTFTGLSFTNKPLY
jgi:hypothetical protein